MNQEFQQIAILRNVGGLVFDATFEETHESTLEITDNPIETGKTISDHAYMRPLRLTITAGVSDTPLRRPYQDQFTQSESRARDAYKALVDLQAKAEPFNVQTGLKLYKSMVVESLRTTQDKDSQNCLIFTATLREVIITTTDIVTYELGATDQQASKTKHKGEQQGKVVTSTNIKQQLKIVKKSNSSESVLHSLLKK